MKKEIPSKMGASWLKLFPEKTEETEKESPKNEDISVSTIQTGSSFGHYKIIREIGSGAMGPVYQAYDNELQREVALKLLLSSSIDQKQTQRFLLEAQATASLRHPNIVTIYDIGTQSQQPFFALEFVNGCSLKERIQKSSLSTQKSLAILIKVGKAMEYAHEKGIIHRDLKPANIMLNKDDEPKIMDFGLAKTTRASKKLSQSGIIIGTLNYMPPEQAQGQLKNIDRRSDVYALGAVLYEVLTGRPPFSGGSTFNLVNQILNKNPIAIRKIKPRIPKELEIICLKALKKKKEQRYQSAGEFVDDLERFSRGEAIMAMPPGLIGYLSRKTRRYILPAAICMILILTGIIVAKVFSGEETPKVIIKKSQMDIDGKKRNKFEMIDPFDDIIKICWDDPFFDFTKKIWIDLPHNKQVKYAKKYQQWYAKKHKQPIEKKIKVAKTTFDIVLIPPGRFWMGSAITEKGRKNNELQHKVTITRPFWISKYEITNLQWQAITPKLQSRHKSFAKSQDLPVLVSFSQTNKFFRKLGKKFALPLEGQWEYACRSGTTSRFYWGQDEFYKKLDNYAWYQTNSSAPTKEFVCPVGQKKPNPWGLYDINGNAWERCQDVLAPYSNKEQIDPYTSIGSSTHNICRGGNTRSTPDYCRSAKRGSQKKRAPIGFRICLKADFP